MHFEEVIVGLTCGTASRNDLENRERPCRNSVRMYAQHAEVLIRDVPSRKLY
jgi:hypothetical protein